MGLCQQSQEPHPHNVGFPKHHPRCSKSLLCWLLSDPKDQHLDGAPCALDSHVNALLFISEIFTQQSTLHSVSPQLWAQCSCRAPVVFLSCRSVSCPRGRPSLLCPLLSGTQTPPGTGSRSQWFQFQPADSCVHVCSPNTTSQEHSLARVCPLCSTLLPSE